jgi:putative ABC transport system permease protein
LASIKDKPVSVGDTVRYAEADFTVVGIARKGVVGRVFMPYSTMSTVRGFAKPRASMFFIKAADPASVSDVTERVREIGLIAISKDSYFEVIAQDFKYLEAFVSSTSALTLLVSFLMILLTMFTIVQEQTREVGILRSMGATKLRIMNLVLAQSMIICSLGVAVGILLTLAARWGIHQKYPLLTMRMDAELVATAIVAGLIGGVLGALYPGWRAATLDPVESLSYE